ncbi:radical SAM protein [Haloferax sp. AB510]|nr:radical SAM protein [Haloferax sp. AB510]MCO8266706.1 radical SAM protein [Haloferax sp. AB510]
MLEEELSVKDTQREWGSYVLYRDELGQRLREHLPRKRKWKRTEFGRGVVGISFSTDCYMDGRAGAITREVVDALTTHEEYARVLTRNPILALQDHDVFVEGGEYVTIGSSIPSMNDEHVAAIEPSAPAPQHRLRGLKEFNELGVQTFVSMSPTYPTMDRRDIRKLLVQISECDPAVIFHEPINPRGANFDMTVEAARDAGEDELADALAELRDVSTWVDYAIDHLQTVQEIGEELGLPVHLWPDKELIKRTNDETSNWLTEWRNRQSPEPFGNRELPTETAPKLETVVS